MRLLNESAIREQWIPLLEEKTGIKDGYKLNWLSKLCHIQELNEQQNVSINETYTYPAYNALSAINGMGGFSAPGTTAGPNAFYTGTTGSGDKFPSLLPMAIQVAARTVGFDIVNVIPMNSPLGVLTYMDFVYAGGKINAAQKPIMIKINAPNINSTAYTVGSTYWGLSDDGDNTNIANTVVAVQLAFIGYSKIDGYPIFRVGETYAMTGTTNGKTADTTVTLAQVFDGVASFITIDSSGPSVQATGGTEVTAAITASAELVKAFEDHIFGPAGAGASDTDDWHGPFTEDSEVSEPMTRETGESTYYRLMGLKLYNKTIQTQTFQAAATVTTEQLQDLNKQWSIDAVAQLENALINEISQNINKHILSRAFALGWSNNAEWLATEGTTLNFTVNRANLAGGNATYRNKLGANQAIAYNGWADFGDFENQSTTQRRIASKVMYAADVISQRGRRGPATFVVTNLQIAAALKDSAQYTFNPVANTIDQSKNGLYPIGTLAGMTVYVDPNMKNSDTRILVGRRGADEDPGLKFCPYIMAETIQTISEGTMSPKIAVKSRYALVEFGHWPETMYYTIYCNVGPAGLV